MITSIRIDDNKKTPFKYTPKIKAIKNDSEFIFKPGVNVIVGKNGSGKSTLLNMISKYMLCEKKMCSKLPSEALYFPDIFDDDKVLDGISIKSDYIGKVFHLLQQTEMGKDDILDNINNLNLYMNGASRSSGEKNLHAMNSLFDFVLNYLSLSSIAKSNILSRHFLISSAYSNRSSFERSLRCQSYIFVYEDSIALFSISSSTFLIGLSFP